MCRSLWFVLAVGAASAGKEKHVAVTGGLNGFLHCLHSQVYQRFYNVLSTHGWHSKETFRFAYNMHNQLDLGAGYDELEDMPWHTTLKVDFCFSMLRLKMQDVEIELSE
ncbi:unnamed protein product [Durusdinium trenchii]|uniref:Uncharacterized protein n=1 Tax=Durusdinium trenchii TaxID=1381693 RepID=A0ABP0P2F3_9DINO